MTKGAGTLKECEEFEPMMLMWSSSRELSRFIPCVATTLTYPSIGVVYALPLSEIGVEEDLPTPHLSQVICGSFIIWLLPPLVLFISPAANGKRIP